MKDFLCCNLISDTILLIIAQHGGHLNLTTVPDIGLLLCDSVPIDCNSVVGAPECCLFHSPASSFLHVDKSMFSQKAILISRQSGYSKEIITQRQAKGIAGCINILTIVITGCM